MKISISGLGYIGLPTAALLANKGYQVRGVDTQSNTVDIINSGSVHIIEPDLDTFVKSAVNSGKLHAATTVEPADAFMICVPTPFVRTEQYPSPDLSYVMQALDAIIPHLKPGNILILESTSPVGTTAKIWQHLQKKGVDTQQLFLAYCPERVLPGKILTELLHNDRIIGGINPQSTEKIRTFYQNFISGNVIGTTSQTAELCKLVENSYRDLSIAFANELSMLCEPMQVDIWELIQLANRHPRVNILQPGVGVGGHCIAVDPWFVISAYPQQTPLIQAARKVNNEKTQYVIKKVLEVVKTFHETYQVQPRVACFGLSFKPNIDDLRESPAMEFTQTMLKSSCQVLAVEPHIQTHETLTLYSIEKALQLADICVFLVNHQDFQDLTIPEEKIIFNFAGVQLNNLPKVNHHG